MKSNRSICLLLAFATTWSSVAAGDCVAGPPPVVIQGVVQKCSVAARHDWPNGVRTVDLRIEMLGREIVEIGTNILVRRPTMPERMVFVIPNQKGKSCESYPVDSELAGIRNRPCCDTPPGGYACQRGLNYLIPDTYLERAINATRELVEALETY